MRLDECGVLCTPEVPEGPHNYVHEHSMLRKYINVPSDFDPKYNIEHIAYHG